MRFDSFVLLEAETGTVTGSAVQTAKFRTFTINYTLGAAIATGSITFQIQYRAADGQWKPLWTFVVDSSGPDTEMPIIQPNTAVGNLRGVITAHNAQDAGSDPVEATLTLEAGD